MLNLIQRNSDFGSGEKNRDVLKISFAESTLVSPTSRDRTGPHFFV